MNQAEQEVLRICRKLRNGWCMREGRDGIKRVVNVNKLSPITPENKFGITIVSSGQTWEHVLELLTKTEEYVRSYGRKHDDL